MDEFAAFLKWARKAWGLNISDDITLARRNDGKIGVFAARDIDVSWRISSNSTLMLYCYVL